MSELEIKLQVEPGAHERLLDALGHRRLRRSTLSARYFDTDDLLLARHRFALRLRQEDGVWVQALKARSGRTADRLEHEVAVDADDDGATPRLDLARHDGSKAGRRLRALLERHRDPALTESCRTEVTRTSRVLQSHGATVEWALDEGEVAADGRSRPISELELELKNGDPAGLVALAHDWQALHGLWIDPASKSERGALLRRQSDWAAPVKAERVAWTAKKVRRWDGATLLRRMVGACVAHILPNAAEIAGGSQDPEHVHQLRVGLRRLRSAARGMGPFAAELPPAWEAALMPVFEALGESRDAHVRATTLAPELAHAGAPVSEAGTTASDQAAALRRLVRGPAFQGLLLRLIGLAHATPDGDAEAGSGLDRLVAHLRKLARQVTRDARGFESLPFERQHQVRKRLKRLRYLAEFAAPAFEQHAVKAWLACVSPAQDALGENIDRVLAARRFEALAASDPRAWFAVGWLRAKAKKSARVARESLVTLKDADAFW